MSWQKRIMLAITVFIFADIIGMFVLLTIGQFNAAMYALAILLGITAALYVLIIVMSFVELIRNSD